MSAWLGPRIVARRGFALLAVAVLAGGARESVERSADRPADRTAEPLPHTHPHLGVPGEFDNRPDDHIRDVISGIVRGPIEDRRRGTKHRPDREIQSSGLSAGRGEARYSLSGRAEVLQRFVVCTGKRRVEAMRRASRSDPGSALAGGPSDTCILVTAAGTRVLPGDRVIVTGYLRTPRGYRVPGAVNLRRLVRARGADLTMTAVDIERGEVAAEWSLWRYPAMARERASAWIAGRGGGASGNSLVRAMTTGDRSGLDRDIEERFRAAGIAHVLAVSGLHLAVVALFAFAAIRRVWAAIPALALRVEPAAAAAVVAAAAALGFTLMTGARISTLRAFLVVAVVLFAAATGRRVRMVDALGFAALILLSSRPGDLFDPSFQLSFSATATLALTIIARPRPCSSIRRVLRAIADLARASLWATLATAPFTALAFGSIAVAGVLTNLVAVPLTEIAIVPPGVLGWVLSIFLGDRVAGVLIDVAVVCAGWLDRLADVVAGAIPPLSVYPPNGLELAVCAVIWTFAICRARGIVSRRIAIAVAVAGVLLLALSHAFTSRWLPAQRDHVQITFLDVGQGDAAVIQLPGGATWMIDGGGLPFVAGDLDPATQKRLAELPGRHSVARFLASERIGHIDRLVISHPHPDHYEGIRAVADQVTIAEVWVARGYDRAPATYRALLRDLIADGVRLVHPDLDQPYLHRGVALTVLAPHYLDGVATADPVSTINDNSLVVRLDFAGRSVLFAGDIEREGEALLLGRTDRAFDIDLVKVPHHGSSTSSTVELLAATRPRWAVISCGLGNRFGHPAPGVIQRWRQAGTRVLGTHRVGAITAVITSDGAMRVSGFDPPWSEY
ncbi:MAG: DNA internalization-related competence protein ComEC/Rec2 [Proteobacteria bacterium]|nr:DNA internalization-related competence protein ComEC/Rec2 [Pseudomonadota bacterium]